MFARLILIASLVFALFSPAYAASPEVTSYTKYETTKSAAWEKYSNTKQKAFEDSQQATQAAFNKYYAFKKAELMKVRAANREKYLEWLDAKETDDMNKYVDLENSVPELSSYRKAVAAAYAEYTKIHDELYAKYKAAEKAAYETFKMTDAEAYKQYQASK